MGDNDATAPPRTLKVLGDGAQQFVVEGVAAKLVWFAVQQNVFLNSPLVKGDIHLHFSGRDSNLNVTAELDN